MPLTPFDCLLILNSVSLENCDEIVDGRKKAPPVLSSRGTGDTTHRVWSGRIVAATALVSDSIAGWRKRRTLASTHTLYFHGEGHSSPCLKAGAFWLQKGNFNRKSPDGRRVVYGILKTYPGWDAAKRRIELCLQGH